ncbi:Ig-like domain-containing protein [Lentilactobacillus kefiri]|uniref:Bacterial group 2 Ig-like protein n=3 Tax=Lentilactobacillus kefiri TaxID=33962 RepID=A0A8E1RI59_LENKE|nr:Ig-like domain-containing protein [Lentilactobacillus kefiri]KRL73278.1 bacterial group 2 Ig-like protein [Lentilactobacillus parakefiri DSM 10551]KRM50062.1 bacterial group 2 Ig-like protein [Lentilactobacillus kefiri DSM 20587 = JCM 5818]MCJ2162360.1 Ig-like domain-containing protein [Lentilactobacillus kefiri]MCP9369604.1 Ig-like domain-containing protein [Lentilactobacillus kefiri]MDH5108930.1 Ig-like domain-containing protein [Lentilactobacillus kefiri]
MKIGKLLVIAAASLTMGVAAMSQPSSTDNSYAAVKRIHGYKIMKPKFYFKYSVINQDSKFNPYKGVTYVSSKYDKVYGTVKNYVDTSKPGKYFVIYHIKDKAGYNFNVKHVITVRAVNLVGIYNPNYNSDGTYDVSNIGDNLNLKPRYNVEATMPGISWTSSNPEVADVSSDGVVSAKADGIAVITATLDGKSSQTPVMVTESSHLNLTNSDDFLSIKYDDSYISYKTKNDLIQYPYGVWITDGAKFGYSDGIDDGSTNPNRRDEISSENGGIFTPNIGTDSMFQDGDTMVLVTKDEFGQSHQYVGQYQYME